MALQLSIAAIGAMRAGPQKEIFQTYCARFDAAAPAIGFRPLIVRDGDPAKQASGAARLRKEAEWLLAAAPKGAAIVSLDERGKSEPTKAFASRLEAWRDEGRRDVAFLIGGADGHGQAVREAADVSIAFGPATWPHLLVRVMLAEQLYRAATILSGSPYHHG